MDRHTRAGLTRLRDQLVVELSDLAEQAELVADDLAAVDDALLVPEPGPARHVRVTLGIPTPRGS